MGGYSKMTQYQVVGWWVRVDLSKTMVRVGRGCGGSDVVGRALVQA